MNTIIKNTIHSALLAVVVTIGVTGSAFAGTIENLERERAILIETFFSPTLSAGERNEKEAVAKHRLVDLERMVLRDSSLAGKNTPAVSKAFSNYDLTFLVHASIEKEKFILDHWLEQLGITTQSVMTARVGRR